MIRGLGAVVKWIWLILLGPGIAWGQSREEYQRLFDEHYLPQVQRLVERGEARAAEAAAEEAMQSGADVAAWRMVYLRALWAQGRLRKAEEKLPGWVQEHAGDVRFLWLASEILREWGQNGEARRVLEQLNEAAQGKPVSKRSAEELVALGRAAVALGAAPQQVLQQFYERAKKLEPENAAIYLAAGELALEKYDYERAGREFREGLKGNPRDAGLRFGLARALWPGDREEALQMAGKVLEANSRHVGALLLRAEHLVDQEEYEGAELQLDLVEKVFPGHPRGRALAAVIAWLRDGDAARRDEAMEAALAYRERNAEVPHLVGRCLSRKYRIRDGERYQRLALEWEPEHGGAKLALATDLLQLGREEEAWKLAEEVAKADPFNVLAFNYRKLSGQLARYQTRETEHFILRMRPDELALYGDRVMALLEGARENLNAKYGVRLEGKTLVEIFAEQQDFAIRTFGELGGAGYLGVCFGTVITMNSPAGAGVATRSNWEATLWHEYCHVVTLQATRNRMPRWLSEGISVYEERERSPVWGARMNRAFRERILGGREGKGLVPVTELSSAFLRSREPEDLMFAYYESSLVVEFLVNRRGVETVRAILGALAEGRRIHEALAGAAGELGKLEAEFAGYAREQAEAYGPGVDWAEPGGEEVNREDLAAVAGYARQRPRSLWAWRRQAELLSGERRWTEAMAAARKMIAVFPGFVEEGNGYELLGRAAQRAGDAAEEAWAWDELEKRKGDDLEASLRLMELRWMKGDWAKVRDHAARVLAVNPFVKRAHWCQGLAAEALGLGKEAAESYGKLAGLSPENPAEVRFRLARALRADDPARARREVVEALLEAPRYREAHRLLAELAGKEGGR